MAIEKIVIILIVAGLARLVIYFTDNIRAHPAKPNPWDAEIEEAIQSPEASPLCHRCFTPFNDQDWFCPHCGASVGPYNNFMPFVYVFSEGEVLRSGTDGHVRFTRPIIVGYTLMACGTYSVLAPLYWYFLWKNILRNADLPPPVDGEEAPPPINAGEK